MIYLSLFWEFFQAGLFAIGGGLATLPFLYQISEKTGWFGIQDIANLIAISESTPGPLGVNMSTYAGYSTGGIPGSLIASLGLVAPSILIILLISRILEAFKANPYVERVFYGLRAASTALIAVAGVGVAKVTFLRQDAPAGGSLTALLDIKALLLALLLYLGLKKYKKHPIVYIVLAAAAGILIPEFC